MSRRKIILDPTCPTIIATPAMTVGEYQWRVSHYNSCLQCKAFHDNRSSTPVLSVSDNELVRELTGQFTPPLEEDQPAWMKVILNAGIISQEARADRKKLAAALDLLVKHKINFNNADSRNAFTSFNETISLGMSATLSAIKSDYKGSNLGDQWKDDAAMWASVIRHSRVFEE